MRINLLMILVGIQSPLLNSNRRRGSSEAILSSRILDGSIEIPSIVRLMLSIVIDSFSQRLLADDWEV
jgi:hypothetical protein